MRGGGPPRVHAHRAGHTDSRGSVEPGGVAAAPPGPAGPAVDWPIRAAATAGDITARRARARSWAAVTWSVAGAAGAGAVAVPPCAEAVVEGVGDGCAGVEAAAGGHVPAELLSGGSAVVVVAMVVAAAVEAVIVAMPEDEAGETTTVMVEAGDAAAFGADELEAALGASAGGGGC